MMKMPVTMRDVEQVLVRQPDWQREHAPAATRTPARASSDPLRAREQSRRLDEQDDDDDRETHGVPVPDDT